MPWIQFKPRNVAYFLLYCLFGCLLLCVLLMASHSATPSTASGTASANPACAQGAMKFGGALAAGSALFLAVPGVGPAGLVLAEVAAAAGIGGVGGFSHMWSCYANAH